MMEERFFETKIKGVCTWIDGSKPSISDIIEGSEEFLTPDDIEIVDITAEAIRINDEITLLRGSMWSNKKMED